MCKNFEDSKALEHDKYIIDNIVMDSKFEDYNRNYRLNE